MKRRTVALWTALMLLVTGFLTFIPVQNTAQANAPSFDVRAEIQDSVEDYVDLAGFDDWAAVIYSVYGKPIPGSYIDQIKSEVKGNNGDYSAASDLYLKVIALTGAGLDVTNIEGVNLLAKTVNFDPAKLTTTDAAWLLISLDSGPHTPPQGAKMTRESLIEQLVKSQLPSGRWSWDNTEQYLDPDTTGLVLTALSPYRSRSDVAQAVNKAVDALKGLQVDNSNSAAWIAQGLISVGQNPLASDFNQNGTNLLDYLYSFKAADVGYNWTIDNPGFKQYSTKDVVLAYLSYQKSLNDSSRHIYYGLNRQAPPADPGSGNTGGSNPGSGQPPQNTPPASPTKIKVDVTVTSNVPHEGLPVSGEVELAQDATAFDALVALVGSGEVDKSGSGAALYVRSIKGLREKDHGPTSGWTYQVNGKTPSQSAGAYKLKDGDSVVWSYAGENDKGGKGGNSGSSEGNGGARQPNDLPIGEQPNGKNEPAVGNSNSSGAAHRFVDAEKISGYAKEAVERARQLGLMVGKPDKDGNLAFDPQGRMTRAEFVTVLMTMLYGDTEVSGGEGFKDVKEKDWYYKYVLKAKEAGLVVGSGNGMFEPNRIITREEIAIILGKAFGIQSEKKEQIFSDVGLDNSQAIAYINGMYEQGIMIGYGGKFRPKDPVTREMAAVIVVSIYDKYLEKRE